MINDTILVQFALALLLIAGALGVGFALARQKYRDESSMQIALLSGEAAKLRRRATTAEDRAKAAESALIRVRRRARR